MRRRRYKQPPNPAEMKINGKAKPPAPYQAVCGNCKLAMELHPVNQCPYIYKAVVLNGRTYGWRMYTKDH